LATRSEGGGGGRGEDEEDAFGERRNRGGSAFLSRTEGSRETESKVVVGGRGVERTGWGTPDEKIRGRRDTLGI